MSLIQDPSSKSEDGLTTRSHKARGHTPYTPKQRLYQGSGARAADADVPSFRSKARRMSGKTPGPGVKEYTKQGLLSTEYIGQPSTPPDQALCVGAGYIVEGVNSGFRVRNATTGDAVTGKEPDSVS